MLTCIQYFNITYKESVNKVRTCWNGCFGNPKLYHYGIKTHNYRYNFTSNYHGRHFFLIIFKNNDILIVRWWNLVLWNSKQFLLYGWHPKCYMVRKVGNIQTLINNPCRHFSFRFSLKVRIKLDYLVAS